MLASLWGWPFVATPSVKGEVRNQEGVATGGHPYNDFNIPNYCFLVVSFSFVWARS